VVGGNNKFKAVEPVLRRRIGKVVGARLDDAKAHSPFGERFEVVVLTGKMCFELEAF
jgi:UPF0288 family protein (methanogenesis marker protein 3)